MSRAPATLNRKWRFAAGYAAREAGCAQLFNCPVSALAREGELQRVTTLDGDYYGRKVLISAGTAIKALCPELPVTPVRKVFARYQADGRYSENNKFPGFTVEMEDGSQYYGFPADNNELKIGRHDGGQPMATGEARRPLAPGPAMVMRCLISCAAFTGRRRLFTRRRLRL